MREIGLQNEGKQLDKELQKNINTLVRRGKGILIAHLPFFKVSDIKTKPKQTSQRALLLCFCTRLLGAFHQGGRKPLKHLVGVSL